MGAQVLVNSRILDRMNSLVSVVTALLLINNGQAFEETHSPQYIVKSAAEKNSIIMANIMEDTTGDDWYGILEMTGMFLEEMCPTFRTPGDELPIEGGGYREKYIHTVGTVGQVEWKDLGGHSYTGIFKGASNGYARLSLAKEPVSTVQETAPGMGLKFLRDGMHSANLVAMYSVNGQESWNFFKNDFTTHIGKADLDLIPLILKFSEATNYVMEVGLSDWGLFGEDGIQVADADFKFPFMLRFKPTGEISFPDEYVNDWKNDLMSIPVGTTLYQVFALDEPEELGGVEAHIADLVLTSALTTSTWGDQHLFFRHQDMADDVALRPEWKDYLETVGLPHDGCPVMKMMENIKNFGKY